MARFRTLRARFALWTAGLLLTAMLGFSAFVYLRTAQGLRASLDDSLQVSAAQAVAGVGGENLNIEDGEVSLGDNLSETSAFTQLQEQGLTIRVLGVDGSVRQAVGAYRELPVDSASLSAATTGAAVFGTLPISGSAAVRVYTLPIQDHSQLVGLVQVMQSLEPVEETLGQLLTAFLVGIPLLVLLAGVGGYLLAARALHPIDTITSTAQRISAADLHARLSLPATQDEVGRLASTFDGMLERLEGAFRRERQFTADASHELRTPLAAMEAILTVTRERPRTGPEYDHALDDLMAQTRRLRGLVEDLLCLARDETHRLTVHEPINLSLLLNDVAETLRPLADERALALHTDISPTLPLNGDSDGLIRLFLNLLDNALNYTPSGTVTLSAYGEDTQIVVTVRDTGIGIAPEHLPHLFERFYRVDAARSDSGAGLGLAIAREIVETHGGTIAVASESGRGTTVLVRLPTM
jgi:heavy metal sensor kinase